MKMRRRMFGFNTAGICGLFLAALFLSVFLASTSHALTLSVVDPAGNPIPVGYRWLVEEDQTWQVDPASPNPVEQGFEFHKSFMPPVAEGTSTDPSFLTNSLDPAKHYFISVLPDEDYAMSGGLVKPGQGSLTVTVQPMPTPTAQISFFIFEDNNPINNSPNLPQERGLAGFKITLEEPAGKYGQNGGQVFYDAFGNFIGTTYVQVNGQYVFDAEGNPIVDQIGDGYAITDADGFAVIKNLYPAKYGTIIEPPAGETWYKTTTIEGTKIIDAWVKPNNPPVFTEFGVSTTHIFSGFVQPFTDPSLTGGATVSGTVIRARMKRPPGFTLTAGAPFPEAFIGLNASAGAGPGLYVGAADPDTGEFSIPNVPPGTYQVVIWDNNLDIIIAFASAIVPDPAAAVDLGDILVNDWFAHFQGHVFVDTNQNGFKDPGEVGLPDQAVNLRWRDGTIYQSTLTGADGFYEFHEIFPFFHWLVAEVDFARYKATGATIVVDTGALANPADPWTFGGELDPQPQPENSNLPYRTETGVILTEAMQAFASMHNIIDWGKLPYAMGENGGISGVVFYDVTRAEDDPRYNAGETFQPGIPRVQVNLYRDSDDDGIIDDEDLSGGVTLADVDNYPLGWSEGGAKGLEDVDHNSNGVFNMGDAIDVTWTDSWDDSIPEDCPGDPADPFYFAAKCYDGLRNYNQVRPGVFDGGYAFDGIGTGIYIVEMAEPRGPDGNVVLKLVRAQDKNVDFGESYIPSTQALPPECVGDTYTVPNTLSLFPGVTPVLAGEELNRCDRKRIELVDGRNAAGDFFLHTQVPIASHFTGLVNNDLAAEFNPLSPNFQEKWGAPFVPVAIRDWTGKEITRVYTDAWGRYNGLVPGTFTKNVASPSGLAPVMLTTCINDAGPMFNAVTGQLELDPFYRREFSQSCYDWQFVSGSTTYLDTPMLSTAAFASRTSFPLDCEFVDGTPVIYSATGPAGGAYVSATGQQLTIASQGTLQVRNPAYDPIGDPGGAPALIDRDYGFGATAGSVTLDGTPLTGVSWSNASITGTVPALAPGSYQLMVTRGDNGQSTKVGVTVTVGPYADGAVMHVSPGAGTPIQDAIDAASTGDLILLDPGTYYELVILYKNVRLQGSGAPSTVLNAMKAPAEKVTNWQTKVTGLVDGGSGAIVDLLPGQATAFGGFPGTGLFATETGPGILVLPNNGDFVASPNARIDGITIIGADSGGAIFANGYADYLEISNNRIVANQGVYGAGVRLGHPVSLAGFATAVDSDNDNVKIHHNQISLNGTNGAEAAGGGVSIYTGCDAYEVSDNYICGNFTTGSGAGIGHKGVSNGGLVARNDVLFNHAFHQPIRQESGGGLSIEGIQVVGALTNGSGDVAVDANLFQGNYAGSGDGGGIRLAFINGQDVADNPGDDSLWHTIDITNNLIVNNISAVAGGAISMVDALRVNIFHNTIAHNDSMAVGGETVDPGLQVTVPQPAGIASRAHTAGFASAAAAATVLPGGEATFSNPVLLNDIVWKNRSFYYSLAANGGLGGLLPHPSVPVYDDFGVLGVAGDFTPENSILTDTTGYSGTNINGDPQFIYGYFNGGAGYLTNADPLTGTGAALDEGGNFIDLEFGPVQPNGNYHILAGSAAQNAGADVSGILPALLATDVDGDTRNVAAPEIGADEFVGGGDIVEITRVIYDAANTRLIVEADSSGAPGVTLNASAVIGGASIDLGAVYWRAHLGYYRSIFTGVTTKPANVIVTSSGGGVDSFTFPGNDLVTITRVLYDAPNTRLIVDATSSAQPGATLNASAVIGVSSVNLGAVYYRTSLGYYRSIFQGVAEQPASVTVASSGGGTATYTFPAPDTVTITRALYDAPNTRLIVDATSSAQPDVTLNASAVIGGSSVNLGAVYYRTALGYYRSIFTGVAEQPTSVTVTSDRGGTDTVAVP